LYYGAGRSLLPGQVFGIARSAVSIRLNPDIEFRRSFPDEGSIALPEYLFRGRILKEKAGPERAGFKDNSHRRIKARQPV
jgi:hypothetical protein